MMLEIRGLSVRIDGHEVVSLDELDIAPGQRLGVVGESGSGKTMLAMSIGGLLPRRAHLTGSIRVNGTEIVGLTDRELANVRRGEIGIIFQDPQRALNPMMRVGRQIAEAIRLHKRQPRSRVRERVVELLGQVRLPDPAAVSRRYPHQLSGGQRQRVLIAMAIACRPKLLIADEPTTALDATVQKDVLGLISELSVANKMALLFVSHDLGVVQSVSEQMAVFYGGHLMEVGSAGDIICDSRHRYTQGLIAANLGRVATQDDEWFIGERFSAIEGSVPLSGSFPQGCRFRGRCTHETSVCSEEPVFTDAGGGHRFKCWNPTTGQEVESHG